MTTHSRSRLLTAMVVGVDVAALAVLGFLATSSVLEKPVITVFLVGLAILVSTRPVRIAVARVEIIASDVFVFLALAGLGPMAAGLVAMGGVIGASIGRRGRPKPMHLAFNLGATCLSAVAAAFVFQALATREPAGLASIAYPFAVATSVYLLANTGLVATVVSLDRGTSFVSVWATTLSWNAIPHVTGFALALAMIPMLRNGVVWSALLGIPVCWLLIRYCRTRKVRLESAVETSS